MVAEEVVAQTGEAAGLAEDEVEVDLIEEARVRVAVLTDEVAVLLIGEAVDRVMVDKMVGKEPVEDHPVLISPQPGIWTIKEDNVNLFFSSIDVPQIVTL